MTTPNEIGARRLRIIIVLWIAAFALLVAAGLLSTFYDDSFLRNDFLVATLLILFGVLTLAVSCAPAVAFLVYARRPGATVTPSLRRSAMISAVGPVSLGAAAATFDEAAVVPFGVALMLLGAAAIVQSFRTPRADATPASPVLRSGASFVGLVFVMLASVATPHGHSASKAYMAGMKSDLRNLVTAQEVFFDSTSRFDTDVKALQFQPTTNVSAPRIVLGDSGWSATNTHLVDTRLTCGIAVKMANPINPVALSGEPVCADTVRKKR